MNQIFFTQVFKNLFCVFLAGFFEKKITVTNIMKTKVLYRIELLNSGYRIFIIFRILSETQSTFLIVV